MIVIKSFFFFTLILHLVLGSPVPLENDVETQRYDVTLTLLEDKTSFTGDEVVSVKAIKEISALRLKYSNVEISAVSVYNPRAPKEELVTSYYREEDNSLHVTLLSPLRKNTVYIVTTEFSGIFEADMTFERLFEQRRNGNIFPCFENSESETIYQMSIVLSQDGQHSEIHPLALNEDIEVFAGTTSDPEDNSTPNTENPNPNPSPNPNPNPSTNPSPNPNPSTSPNPRPPTTQTPSTTKKPNTAASYSMISNTLLSIVAICVISLR